MIAGAVLLLAIGSVPPAQSFEAQWKQCVNADLKKDDADVVIGACNALLQSGRVLPADMGMVLAGRGEARLEKEDFVMALDDFARAISLSAEDSRGFVWALKGRAATYEKLHRFEAAVADLSRAARLAPGDAWVHEQWGTACYRMKKDLACAFDHWERATAIDATASSSFYEDALVDSGDLDLAHRRYESAIDKYRRAQSRNPFWMVDADLSIRLARALRRAKHGGEALAILDGVVRDDGSPDALIERAVTRMTNDQDADAIADLNSVLAKEPVNAAALYLRGVAQQRINTAGIGDPARDQPVEKWDSAEADITRARALDANVGAAYWPEDLISAYSFRPSGPPETRRPSTGDPAGRQEADARELVGTQRHDSRRSVPAEEAFVAIAGEPGTVRRQLFPFVFSMAIGLAIVIRRLVRKR